MFPTCFVPAKYRFSQAWRASHALCRLAMNARDSTDPLTPTAGTAAHSLITHESFGPKRLLGNRPLAAILRLTQPSWRKCARFARPAVAREARGVHRCPH